MLLINIPEKRTRRRYPRSRNQQGCTCRRLAYNAEESYVDPTKCSLSFEKSWARSIFTAEKKIYGTFDFNDERNYRYIFLKLNFFKISKPKPKTIFQILKGKFYVLQLQACRNLKSIKFANFLNITYP